MSAELAEYDEVAAAVEGTRQAQTDLRSLMMLLGDPDRFFNSLQPAFAEGPPYARARAMCRTWQKAVEATA